MTILGLNPLCLSLIALTLDWIHLKETSYPRDRNRSLMKSWKLTTPNTFSTECSRVSLVIPLYKTRMERLWACWLALRVLKAAKAILPRGLRSQLRRIISSKATLSSLTSRTTALKNRSKVLARVQSCLMIWRNLLKANKLAEVESIVVSLRINRMTLQKERVWVMSC